MLTVGIRELKSRLSEYLRAVRNGAEVLVTDRGHVIARIGPPSAAHLPALPQNAADLTHQDIMLSGTGNAAELYPRTKRTLSRGTTPDLLSEDRGHH